MQEVGEVGEVGEVADVADVTDVGEVADTQLAGDGRERVGERNQTPFFGRGVRDPSQGAGGEGPAGRHDVLLDH